MLEPLREETEGILQMLLSPRRNSLDSLFKEVRAFKVLQNLGGGPNLHVFFSWGDPKIQIPPRPLQQKTYTHLLLCSE